MKRLVAILTLLMVVAPAVEANHLETLIGPSEPARRFPKAFMKLLPHDRQQKIAERPKWDDPRIGGWGRGKNPRCPRDHERRRPVVFVHGNGQDAWFWREKPSGNGTIVNVRRRFLKRGYCARELWAISYTGAEGYTTYNDINTKELYLFIQAVRRFTRAKKVDLVAHSLGVTVVRKAAFRYPELYDQTGAFVAIAGANHGTSSCRGAGEAEASHVCEEVHPGSQWLERLNSIGETPAGPRYLTIYEGTGTTDNFYLGEDGQSPRLEGACNFEMPYTAHNTLARGREAVGIYLPYLRDRKEPDCTTGG